MRRYRLPAALLIVALVAGCVSPAAQLRTATDTYATTLHALADLRRTGYIDDAEAARIESVRVVARAALDTWRSALEAGAPDPEAIATFGDALADLVGARTELEARHNDTD